MTFAGAWAARQPYKSAPRASKSAPMPCASAVQVSPRASKSVPSPPKLASWQSKSAQGIPSHPQSGKRTKWMSAFYDKYQCGKRKKLIDLGDDGPLISGIRVRQAKDFSFTWDMNEYVCQGIADRYHSASWIHQRNR